MAASPEEQARQDYSHRLAQDEFFRSSSVLESVISDILEEDGFREKGWYDDVEAFRTEIELGENFGAIAVNHLKENEDAKEVVKPSIRFRGETGNEIIDDWISEEEIIDAGCIEITDRQLKVGISITGRGKELSIRPEYVFGVVVYGSPPMAESFEERLKAEYGEDQVADVTEPCLGRGTFYIEGKTSILEIGYRPPEVDREIAKYEE